MNTLLAAITLLTAPALATQTLHDCGRYPVCTIKKINPRPDNCHGKGCFNYCVTMDRNNVDCFNVFKERGEENARNKAIRLAKELIQAGLCNNGN